MRGVTSVQRHARSCQRRIYQVPQIFSLFFNFISQLQHWQTGLLSTQQGMAERKSLSDDAEISWTVTCVYILARCCRQFVPVVMRTRTTSQKESRKGEQNFKSSLEASKFPAGGWTGMALWEGKHDDAITTRQYHASQFLSTRQPLTSSFCCWRNMHLKSRDKPARRKKLTCIHKFLSITLRLSDGDGGLSLCTCVQGLFAGVFAAWHFSLDCQDCARNARCFQFLACCVFFLAFPFYFLVRISLSYSSSMSTHFCIFFKLSSQGLSFSSCLSQLNEM